MVTIIVNSPFPKGTEIAIAELGAFPNLTPVELSAEQVAAFENKTGVDIEDYYKNSPQVTVTHTKEKQLTIETKTNKEVTK